MSWYRRYRPTRIADLHLTQVRHTMQQLMKAGKLPQVLLFTGAKGTGKTSTARILAAMVNDPANAEVVDHLFFGKTQPKQTSFQDPDQSNDLVKQIQSGSSLNVVELDAASHRGIDDVRALKDRVYLAPQQGKMSVYILDEAHMLTTEAFNALLKMLEEPPAHALFVLATTEAHKIPSTVASRATIVSFTKATLTEIEAAVTRVLEAEKITFDKAGLALVAERADGSFRDAIKLVEQIATQASEITATSVAQTGSGSLAAAAQQLIEAVLAKNEQQVVKVIGDLRQQGIDQTALYKAVVAWLHRQLLMSLGVEAGTAAMNEKVSHFLLSEVLKFNLTLATPIPLLNLELGLLDLVFRSKAKKSPSGTTTPSGTTGSGVVKSAAAVSKAQELKSEAVHAQESSLSSRPILQASSLPEAMAGLDEFELIAPTEALQQASTSDNVIIPDPAQTEQLISKWGEFVNMVKQKNGSIAAVLQSSRPTQSDDGKTQVEVFYKFHKEQLQQPKFAKMLAECVQEIVGQPVPFRFVVAEGGIPVVAATPVTTVTPDQTGPVPSYKAQPATPPSGPVDGLVALAAEVLV